MSDFYMDTNEGILVLTSTSNIKVVQDSRATQHPLESGDTASDNIVNNNTRISFQGVISQIVSFSLSYSEEGGQAPSVNTNQRTVEDYINTIRRVRDSKEPFTVYYDSRSFGFANDCYITNLSIERDASTGLGYRVDLSFEQIRVVNPANVTVTRDNQAEPDDTQSKTTSGGSNTEEESTGDWTDGKIVISEFDLLFGSGEPPIEGGG